ncbi:MAG: hypothetical protein COB66_04225 [Coxiella sp. (in: Bacteria)]|nr:MAG: hypothetical protein COB66_04225 [Coxiella sp. (in: g-proteobacteria)]
MNKLRLNYFIAYLSLDAHKLKTAGATDFAVYVRRPSFKNKQGGLDLEQIIEMLEQKLRDTILSKSAS